MNVASLDLCKELYELSGWMGESRYIWTLDGRSIPTERLKTIEEIDVPAYDLGYLLRKLPPKSRIFKLAENQYGCAYGGLNQRQYMSRADTPENVACLLAIKLLEEGILMRSQS